MFDSSVKMLFNICLVLLIINYFVTATNLSADNKKPTPAILRKSNTTNHESLKLNSIHRNATKFPSSNQRPLDHIPTTQKLTIQKILSNHNRTKPSKLPLNLNTTHPNTTKISHPASSNSSNLNATSSLTLTSGSTTNTDGSLTLSEMLLKEYSYLTNAQSSSSIASITSISSSSSNSSANNVSLFTQSLNEFAMALYKVIQTEQQF